MWVKYSDYCSGPAAYYSSCDLLASGVRCRHVASASPETHISTAAPPPLTSDLQRTIMGLPKKAGTLPH